MIDIKNLTLEELEKIFSTFSLERYHASQVFSWVYQKEIQDFSLMTDLCKDLRKLLEEKFYFSKIILENRKTSRDGTEKFLLQLFDGNFIETVVIPTEERLTICISTQVGCKYRCLFCASGRLGFKRNLTTSEIINQFLFAKKELKQNFTNIVFMGIGEPLDNYDNLLSAIRILNSPKGINFGARRMTISTSGIIPAIEKLQKENLQIELSISLHAPNDKIRNQLMGINKIYPLEKLIKSCKKYIAKTNRAITFEYILFHNINSSVLCAQELANLLRGLNCKVNIIPYNEIKELGYQSPRKLEMLLFYQTLKKLKISAIIRRPRGKDIEAACGQLRLKKIQNSNIKNQNGS
ncbi:MAG: 23S rRNA (adenine(2503)-C(2))-methyltransferase RlmN [Candidatus Omnitrophota bacterium]